MPTTPTDNASVARSAASRRFINWLVSDHLGGARIIIDPTMT